MASSSSDSEESFVETTSNENNSTKQYYNLPRKRKVKLARKIEKNSVQKWKADSDTRTRVAAPSPAVDCLRPALHAMSPNVASQSSTKHVCFKSQQNTSDLMMKKAMGWSSPHHNVFSTMNAEELGEAMASTALTYLKTDKEAVIAGKVFVDMVTGEFLSEDYGKGIEEIPVQVTVVSPRNATVLKITENANTPTIDVTKKAFYIKPSTGGIQNGFI
jgi:hypothetical protein